MIDHKRKADENCNDISKKMKIEEAPIASLPKHLLAKIIRLSENKNTRYVNKLFHKAFHLSCLDFREINSRNIEIFAKKKLVEWKKNFGVNAMCAISSVFVNGFEDFWFIYDILLKLHKEVTIQCVDLQGECFDDELNLINDLIGFVPKLECLKVQLSDIKKVLDIKKPEISDHFEIHVSATSWIDSVNSESDDDSLNSLLIDMKSLPKHIKVVNLDISELVYNKDNDKRVIEGIIEACPDLRTLTFSSCELALDPGLEKVEKYLRIDVSDENECGMAYAWLEKLSEMPLHIHINIRQKIDDNTIELYNALFERYPNIESIEVESIDTSNNLKLPKNLRKFSCRYIYENTKLELQFLMFLSKIKVLNLRGSLVVSQNTIRDIATKSDTAEVVIWDGIVKDASPSDVSSSDEN